MLQFRVNTLEAAMLLKRFFEFSKAGTVMFFPYSLFKRENCVL